MTMLSQPVEAVTVSQHPAGLATILEPGCSAALWQRPVPASVQSWLNALKPECLPTGRVILPPSAVLETLGHLFEMSGLPEGPERDWLRDDITALAAQFAELMEAQFLRLRLDVVTTNACRKFHIDALTARLVCTYRGTGTQYGISQNGQDPRHVATVPAGAPLLLRGTLWPADPPTGLLHRSPPIEGTGETRLVLVLDPILDPHDTM